MTIKFKDDDFYSNFPVRIDGIPHPDSGNPGELMMTATQARDLLAALESERDTILARALQENE